MQNEMPASVIFANSLEKKGAGIQKNVKTKFVSTHLEPHRNYMENAYDIHYLMPTVIEMKYAHLL